MPRIMLLCLLLLGCAQAPPPGGAPLSGERKVPAKCTACHLAPREHGLAPSRWDHFLKNHRRRIRLTREEKAFLYDFLVGGEMPPAPTP
jgi:hypothetical protein